MSTCKCCNKKLNTISIKLNKAIDDYIKANLKAKLKQSKEPYIEYSKIRKELSNEFWDELMKKHHIRDLECDEDYNEYNKYLDKKLKQIFN